MTTLVHDAIGSTEKLTTAEISNGTSASAVTAVTATTTVAAVTAGTVANTAAAPVKQVQRSFRPLLLKVLPPLFGIALMVLIWSIIAVKDSSFLRRG
jgi:hypothetical protein